MQLPHPLVPEALQLEERERGIGLVLEELGDLGLGLREDTMTRKLLKPTRLAVVLQAAGLLAVADAVLTVLISNVSRHRAAVEKAEAPPPDAQLLATPH